MIFYILWYAVRLHYNFSFSGVYVGPPPFALPKGEIKSRRSLDSLSGIYIGHRSPPQSPLFDETPSQPELTTAAPAPPAAPLAVDSESGVYMGPDEVLTKEKS